VLSISYYKSYENLTTKKKSDFIFKFKLKIYHIDKNDFYCIFYFLFSIVKSTFYVSLYYIKCFNLLFALGLVYVVSTLSKCHIVMWFFKSMATYEESKSMTKYNNQEHSTVERHECQHDQISQSNPKDMQKGLN